MSDLYIESRLQAIKEIANASCSDEEDIDNICNFCDKIYLRYAIETQEHDREVYNKAIDDFVEDYKSKTTMENKLVEEIAEQLKEGV